MTVALICPANRSYMPYIRAYEKILCECNKEYITINWDRLGIEEEGEFTYKDARRGHQRNLLDYYNYFKFARGIMKEHQFGRVVIFGLQLGFFFSKFLVGRYRAKYVFDIRDDNRITRIWNPKNVVKHSFKTVISSPGYLDWLPPSENYLVNHNTTVGSLKELYPVDVELKENTMFLRGSVQV